MRKLYSTVETAQTPEGHAIHLDGKPVKTPAKNLLLLGTAALAEGVAGEWRAQEVFIVPASMPLTQLAGTAIDRVAPHRDTIIDGVVEYVATDLVCYRALDPADLVREQAALFDPLLEWFEERTGQSLVVVRGIMPVEQPDAALAAVRAILEEKSAWDLTAIQFAAALASSLVIALALEEGRLDGEQAFTTANVEELYQIRKWGEDEEARTRLGSARAEFAALERFVGLARG